MVKTFCNEKDSIHDFDWIKTLFRVKSYFSTYQTQFDSLDDLRV